MKSVINISGLNSQILKIAIPAIVSNITVPLLGICDTGVTGHLGNPVFIAAIAVGTMMINVLLWSFGFLRMGTTGLTAQAFGGNNKKETEILFTRSLLLAFLIGGLLVILQYPFRLMLSEIIGPDNSVRNLSDEYFSICIWGAPGILGSMAISGWFLGMQNSLLPMIIAITANVINIMASILLSFPCGLGFTGTALGTLIANWSSLLISILLVYKFCHKKLPLVSLKKAIDLRGMGRFFKVNGDIFFRSFFIMAVSLGITSIGARLGEHTLAVNAVIMQFFFLFSYFMDGFAFSAEALSGKAMGAGDKEGLNRIVKRLLLCSLTVTAIFTIIYLPGYRLFANILVPDEIILKSLDEMKVWIWLLPSVSFLAFIYDGFYIGLTATRTMLLVTAIASITFFAFNFLFPSPEKSEGATRLWLAFEIYLLIRGLALAVCYPSVLKKLKLNFR